MTRQWSVRAAALPFTQGRLSLSGTAALHRNRFYTGSAEPAQESGGVPNFRGGIVFFKPIQPRISAQDTIEPVKSGVARRVVERSGTARRE